MKQVFLLVPGKEFPDLEKIDALPLAERLIPRLLADFPDSAASGYTLSAAVAHTFLREFYSHYELSQPQRRVWLRFEQILAELPPDQEVQLTAANVSERRSRRNPKKNEQLY